MKSEELINPLTSKINCKKIQANPRKRFIQIPVDKHEGLETYKCPKCYQNFGLQVTLIEKMSEVNFHYFCPYCGFDGGIENP